CLVGLRREPGLLVDRGGEGGDPALGDGTHRLTQRLVVLGGAEQVEVWVGAHGRDATGGFEALAPQGPARLDHRGSGVGTEEVPRVYLFGDVGQVRGAAGGDEGVGRGVGLVQVAPAG